MTAQNARAALRHDRRAARRRRRRRSWSARASAPSAPRRSPSGSPTTTTARSIEELRAIPLVLEADEERPAGRGAADRQAVRDHRHARVVHARGGEGGARGARREGLRRRLEEDGGRDRRREPGRRRSRRRRRRACRCSPRTTCARCSRASAARSRARPAVPRAPHRGGGHSAEAGGTAAASAGACWRIPGMRKALKIAAANQTRSNQLQTPLSESVKMSQVVEEKMPSCEQIRLGPRDLEVLADQHADHGARRPTRPGTASRGCRARQPPRRSRRRGRRPTRRCPTRGSST